MSAGLHLVPPAGRFDEPAEHVDVPPHDLEAEAAVLGAILVDERLLARVESFLRPEHFFADRHREAFAAILGVRGEKKPLDMVTLGTWLRERDRDRRVGGIAYLTELLGASWDARNIVAHAGIVHSKWRLRVLVASCQAFAARGYHEAIEPQDLAEEIAKRASSVAQDNPLHPIPTNEQTIAKILQNITSDHAESASEVMLGYPTGLHTLDRHLGGLAAGHKITVAATTGAGKTAFATQLAFHVAKLGVGVLMFSTEVPRELVIFRAISNESGVDSSHMKRRTLSSEEISRAFDAGETLRKLPVTIDESARLTADDVRTRVASMVDRMPTLHRVPLGLVIVDYVQRLEPGKSMHWRPKHEQVAASTKALKQIAQEHRLCVLELAQAKKYERRGGGQTKMPSLDDGISDTKEIKNEADDVVFLVPHQKLDNGAIDVTAYIAKQRGGPAKVEVDLEYHGAMYRFEDPADPLRCPSRDLLSGYS